MVTLIIQRLLDLQFIKKLAGGLFFRYFFVSAICLVIDYTVFLVGSFLLELAVEVSAVLGYLFGLVVAFLLMVSHVFDKANRRASRSIELFLFFISGGLGIGITYVVTLTMVTIMPSSIVMPKLAATIVSFLSVYLFRKKVVFASPE